MCSSWQSRLQKQRRVGRRQEIDRARARLFGVLLVSFTGVASELRKNVATRLKRLCMSLVSFLSELGKPFVTSKLMQFGYTEGVFRSGYNEMYRIYAWYVWLVQPFS